MERKCEHHRNHNITKLTDRTQLHVKILLRVLLRV